MSDDHDTPPHPPQPIEALDGQIESCDAAFLEAETYYKYRVRPRLRLLSFPTLPKAADNTCKNSSPIIGDGHLHSPSGLPAFLHANRVAINPHTPFINTLNLRRL